MGLVYQTVIALIIVGQTEPLLTRKDNKMEFFNETMIMFVMYIMICFTDFMPDLETREVLGKLCIFVVMLHIIVNIFFMGKDTARNVYLRYTKWKLFRKYAKIRAEKIYAYQKKQRHRNYRNEYKIRKAKLERKERREELRRIREAIGKEHKDLQLGYKPAMEKGDDFGNISVSEASDAQYYNENVDRNDAIQRGPVEAPENKKAIIKEFDHSLKGPE